MEEEIIFRIELDREKASTDLQNVTNQVQALKNENKLLTDAINNLSKAEGDHTKTIQAATREIELNKEKIRDSISNQKALTVVVNNETNSINSLKAQVKLLASERDGLNIKTAEGKQRLIEINAQIDDNNKKIADNVSGLEKQRLNFSGFGAQLEKLIPGLGGISEGLVQFGENVGRVGLSLKALGGIPIIAFITAVATAIQFLTEKFKEQNQVVKQAIELRSRYDEMVLGTSRAVELLKAQGASNIEVTAKEIELASISLANVKRKLTELPLDASIETIRKLRDERDDLDLQIKILLARQDQEIQDFNKKAEEDRKKAHDDNQKALDEDLDMYREAYDLKVEASQEKFDREQELRNEEIVQEQEKFDILADMVETYHKRTKAADEKRIKDYKATVKSERDLTKIRIDLAGQLGDTIQQLAGENKHLAILGLLVSKGSSIARIIASTGIANAEAVAASPLTLGQPWVGINTATAALSIASIIGTTAQAISSFALGGILKKFSVGGIANNGGVLNGPSHAHGGIPFSVGGRLGFEAEGGEAIINKRSTQMFKSQLSAINQAGGGKPFAVGGVLTNEIARVSEQATSQREIFDAISQIKMFVTVEDINLGQRRVQVIDERAKVL